MAGKKRSGLANDRRAYTYACAPTTYTVIYDGNTSTGGNAPIDASSSLYLYGLTVTVLGNSGSPVLTKTGFAFDGWNTAANGSGTSYSQGDTFKITGNKVLYAQWIPTYTVTYDGNTNTSGNAPVDGSSPYIVGSTVTVLGNSGSPALAKSGFAFSGWNTAANGSGTSYSQSNTFAINADVTLYAQWTPTYTVTYDGNSNTSGNAPVDGSSPYVTGSTVTVLGNSGSPVLEKSGYTFSGWNTESDGSGTSYSQGNTFAINADVTLYAQWALITYTVTYNGNTNTSGNVPTDDSSPYVVGSTVTVLGNSGSPVLEKSGYIFAGWNTLANGSGTSYSQGSTFTINANTTLYAVWAVVTAPPTLTFSVGGNQAAYILFTQSGNVTNYEYSTDDGATFLPFDPSQVFSPVEINVLSSDGTTRLTNGVTYTVKLRAVNNGVSSSDSNSITVVPTVTSLLNTNRIIYLDANNSSSYPGSGTTWTNLDSGGSYSATLNGSPTFDNTTDPGNNYFEFNKDTTGQFALINQAAAINPVVNQPFTIQMWVRVKAGSDGGSLVSKIYDQSRGFDGYNFTYFSNSSIRIHLNGQSIDTNNTNFYPNFISSAGVLSNGWALYTANVQFGNGGGRQNKIFVNGRQVITATSNETFIPNNNQNLTILSGFGGDAECDIGQFYYYNTELSVTEVIQNYDATKPRYL